MMPQCNSDRSEPGHGTGPSVERRARERSRSPERGRGFGRNPGAARASESRLPAGPFPFLGWIALVGILSAGAVAPRPASIVHAQSEGSAAAACGTKGWQSLSLVGASDDMNFHSLAVTPERIYVAGTSPDASLTLGGGLEDARLGQLTGSVSGQRVTDLLVTPDITHTLAWASGFGNANVSGAAPESPVSFSAYGSFDAWPMQLLQAGDQVLAAASRPGDEGIYRWDGTLWNKIGGDEMSTVAFWASAESPERLWIGTERRGVWYSDADELGTLWQSANTPAFSRATVTALAVDPADPERVALGFGPVQEGAQPAKGVRVSQNGGTSWEYVAFDDEAGVDYVADLAFSRSKENATDPPMLFAALYGRGIRVSRDGGATWGERLLRYNRDIFELNDSLYVSAIETVQPAARPGCELLVAAGIGGVMVHDLASIRDMRIFLPNAPKRFDRAYPPENLLAAPSPGPAPARAPLDSPKLQLPSDEG